MPAMSARADLKDSATSPGAEWWPVRRQPGIRALTPGVGGGVAPIDSHIGDLPASGPREALAENP